MKLMINFHAYTHTHTCTHSAHAHTCTHAGAHTQYRLGNLVVIGICLNLLGSHSKVPQTGWFNSGDFSQFWTLQVWAQGTCMVGSGGNPLPSCRRPPSHCELTWRRTELVSVLFLIRAPVLWGQSLSLVPLNLKSLLLGLFSSTAVRGLGFSLTILLNKSISNSSAPGHCEDRSAECQVGPGSAIALLGRLVASKQVTPWWKLEWNEELSLPCWFWGKNFLAKANEISCSGV